MKKQLAIRAIVKFLSGLGAMGLLLFLPAGTFRFPGAWRMICVLFIPMLVLGMVLFFRKPDLLEKRLSTQETEPEQKRVILFSGLMFVTCFALCGFDFRFGWTHVPLWLYVSAIGVFLLTYLGFAELLRENKYLSRTVAVQSGQQVIDTGLYGIIRHPMYAIILFMFLSMPLIIGSFVGLIPLTPLPFLLAVRIRNEEHLLQKELSGYERYMNKVKYRMIPYLW